MVVLGLLVAVVLLTTVARRLRLPYPSLLALGGLILAVLPGLPDVEIAPDLVLQVFLPPLLFSTGWRLSWREFVRNLRPIAILAVGLVLFTTIGVGVAAHWLAPELPLGAAFVLGAIVCPTDPLAASAVARQVRLPTSILTVLEGESLANDATGIVVYRIAVGAVASQSFSVMGGAYTFAVAAAGGIVIGVAIGAISVQVQRRIDDPPIEFAVQLLTSYASYFAAERIGVSGVFAAATAGLFCGQFWSYALGARGRLQVVPVWDTLDVLLNAVLFLLLGLQLPAVLRQSGESDLGRLLVIGLALSLLAVVLRMTWMFAGVVVARLRSAASTWPPNVVALLGWSGMRGVLSLATALAVPAALADGTPFPARAHILFYAFATIVFTLVVQGLCLPYVIRLLKIPREEPNLDEDTIARSRMALAALDRLDDLIGEGDELRRELAAEMREGYRKLNERLDAETRAKQSGRVQTESALLRHEVARAQRQALLDLHRRHLIGSETFRRMERELDLDES